MRRCFFDPKRACGSYSRSKFAYRRADLVHLAEQCGMEDANKLTIDALCNLLREMEFQRQAGEDMVRLFQDLDPTTIHGETWKTYMPIPIETPTFTNGTLTLDNAVALRRDTLAMSNFRGAAERLKRRTKDFSKRDLYQFYLSTNIFMPSAKLLDDAQENVLKKEFGTNMMRLADVFRAKMLLYEQQAAKTLQHPKSAQQEARDIERLREAKEEEARLREESREEAKRTREETKEETKRGETKEETILPAEPELPPDLFGAEDPFGPEDPFAPPIVFESIPDL